MKFTLYRRMSIVEAEQVIKNNQFYKPQSEILLPRKWFSTSILKTHYFKSPFYNGETVVVKVDINEDYFRRIFEEGTFLLKEPNGFYGYNESKEDILYANAHKTINGFYNIGFLDLDTFNRQFSSVDVLPENTYLDYMEQEILGGSIRNFVTEGEVEESRDFYVQNSFDTAAYAYKYQTIMPEMIDPILKRVYFEKDLARLTRYNLDRYPVTLRVRFKKEFMKLGIYNEFGFSLDIGQMIKYASYVESVSIVNVLERKDVTKRFIQVSGDNCYTKHEKVNGPNYERISFEDFEVMTTLLCKKDFKIEDVTYFMPSILDVEGIHQVDPRHIDSLKTHIEKVICMSSLVINYFKDQGMSMDQETIVYLKWLLLFHDLGKPYCECRNITTRYSQFGDKSKYTLEIIDRALDEDIAFPIKAIYRIFNLSSLALHKKIKTLMKQLLQEIKEYYEVDDHGAFTYLNKFIKVGFMAKVAHSASLKTRAFCSSYVDDLMFMDRVSLVLFSLGDYDFSFDYDYFYGDLFQAYAEIVEGFYIENKKTTLETVREMVQSDPKDLEYVYDLKLKHPHKILDSEQYPYDELLCAYFMEDNDLLSRYFSDVIVDTDKHGQIHSERVGILTYLLGKLKALSDEDIEILLLASKYHDIGRRVRDDNKHSIESLKLLKKENILGEYANKEYVYYLVFAHGFKDSFDEELLNEFKVDKERALKLLGLFKDADALDRVRYDTERNYGSILNVKYLRNEESVKLIKFAYMLNSQYKLDKKELSVSVKKLLKN